MACYAGAKVTHLKPHGALNNMAAENLELALAIGRAMKTVDRQIIYVALAGSQMEKAALEQGIPADLARLMARRTVSGSGALLAASTEDAAQLRRNVTSPKGTTERALAVLMDEAAWPRAISAAIAAATARSRELAG